MGWFDIQKAEKKYKEGNFAEAKNLYATLAESKKSPIDWYNAGTSAYKEKQYDQAVISFKNALELAHNDNLLQEKIYYNTGNSSFKLEKYQEAIDAYKQALEKNKDNKEAAHNLKIAE